MNKFKTNYKTVISVTENSKPLTYLYKQECLNDPKQAVKAKALNALGFKMSSSSDNDMFDVVMNPIELFSSSHEDESELFMTLYWKLAKLFTSDIDSSHGNVIKHFGMDIGNDSLQDNMKVVTIKLDFA